MNSRTTPRGGYPAGAQQAYQPAPNAALLIDFDNVTMAIRSDLGKELKTLLNSEVIRGKVAVQRAYADWRRYPQYIVPLAESSVDLIFAPAYGSSKKNATDLRMAIDAMELVFTRPEIGTYILMTGDSDFSSCVLKLKEYGKYVIGVGMRESSSDLLIQNCDEYYSYHSLSGLTREGEVEDSKEDPWVLVKRAVQQMVKNGDVMRTDRLKQVMLELDPAFDEKKIGYSKFSRFVSEAASKGVLRLKKTENGQFEILDDSAPAKSREEVVEKIVADADATGNGRRRRGGRGRDDREEKRTREPEPLPEKPKAEAPQEEPKAEAESSGQAKPTAEAGAAKGDGAPVDNLEAAYALLQEAVRKSTSRDSKGVRDGDVKRKMLEISRAFDEAKLGFSKFTRFLRQAHDAEVIDLSRAGAGNYEVSLPSDGRTLPPPQVGGGGQEAAKQEVAKQESSAQEAPARKEEATPATQPSRPRVPAACRTRQRPQDDVGDR
ncbi:MAG: NYN domain-containing protein, partial [Gemmatimonadota bacterium]